MTLYRVELREQVAAALIAANTIAGSQVYTARSWPMAVPRLPFIELQILSDKAESWGPAEAAYTRTAMLLVIAKASYGKFSEGTDLMDQVCEQIELAVINWSIVPGSNGFLPVQQIKTIDTEISFDADSGTQIAVARLQFALEYPQTYGLPGVPLTAITAEIVNQSTGNVLANMQVDVAQATSTPAT